MANKLDNLMPIEKVNSNRTREQHSEDSRQGGIASGKARREKATMKQTLEMLLNETNSKGKTYKELATLGLLKGAINGNASNYRTILETLGELNSLGEAESTPTIKIEVSDNSKLEGVMYEANRPSSNDDK